MALQAGLSVLFWLVVVFLASTVRSLSLLNGSAREILDEAKDTSSKRLLKLIDSKYEVLLTLNTFLSVASVFLVIQLFTTLGDIPFIANLDLPLRSLLLVVSTTVLLITATKIVPRIVSRGMSMKYSKATSLFTLIVHQIFSPISRPATRWFNSTIGYGNPRVQYLSGDDLKALADIGEAQGTIEEDERELIHSIMDFGDTTVREIMISRLDIDAIPFTATLEDALEMIQDTGHSRLPLYEDHLDNILGFVYVKDLLPFISPTNGLVRPNWRKTVRKPFFVPASKPLDDLLKDFQTMKMHIAIVVDDYGGTAGLVTMEDVLEEIVGDIRDEYDEAEEDMYEQIDEHTHVFDARINLDDLCDHLNIELDFESYDFETLGGLIFHLKGEVPGEGDQVEYESMTMRIESVENHRIGRVFIKVHPPTADKSLVA